MCLLHLFIYSVGYFIEPTLVETKDPNSKLMNEVIVIFSRFALYSLVQRVSNSVDLRA